MRVLFPLFLALALFPADWPQFRGHQGSGLCPTCGTVPTNFGPQSNVLWKTSLPAGKSSPIIVGDRIFLTAADTNELFTICLSRATGETLWRRSLRSPRREAQHTLNHRAAPTAATDGKQVFVFFADFGLVAYDFEGNERWKLPLGPFNSQHGIVASPVYADGKVILVCDQDTDAFILAADASSGKVAWKVPRDVINGYSTPIIYRPASGPTQVIAPGSYQLTSYSVADGKTVWFVRGLTCQPKSPPTISGDIIYFNGWTPGNDAGQQVDLPPFQEVAAAADKNHDGKLSPEELPQPWKPTGTWRAVDLDRDGFLNEREWSFFRTRRASRNGVLAIKLGGVGDLTATNVLWRFEKSLPDVSAPLVYNDTVFLFRNGGIATALDARTGAVRKQARLTGALEDYYASPLGVDGKVYIASEHGKVVVLRAAGEWEILAVNDFESDIYATPALVDGKLYIRTQDALFAIGAPSKP
ncbi:MAG TPA: PQQ-binding-like beta-propeller repeat protein [Bryobacteraceae bacterium]|nr:PQQ-binding-like beta-propeller repeat protein [Bryobacteraceae bacterium]